MKFDGKFCANRRRFSWIISLEHFVVDERWIVFIVNVMNYICGYSLMLLKLIFCYIMWRHLSVKSQFGATLFQTDCKILIKKTLFENYSISRLVVRAVERLEGAVRVWRPWRNMWFIVLIVPSRFLLQGQQIIRTSLCDQHEREFGKWRKGTLFDA